MNYILFFFLTLFTIFNGYSQRTKSIKFDELEHLINDDFDGVKVINFWATWCGPCVKELHQFEEINNLYKEHDLKVILISLDFTIEKVERFVTARDIQSSVYYLDETDYNAYIDKIDPRWTGAIPMTLIISEERIFIEKEFEEGELENIIKQLI